MNAELSTSRKELSKAREAKKDSDAVRALINSQLDERELQIVRAETKAGRDLKARKRLEAERLDAKTSAATAAAELETVRQQFHALRGEHEHLQHSLATARQTSQRSTADLAIQLKRNRTLADEVDQLTRANAAQDQRLENLNSDTLRREAQIDD